MIENLEEKYNSVLQIQAMLADTQNLGVEIGRGAGKTTEILAPRFVRVTYDLAGSVVLLTASTYIFIIETIVPGILTYLAKNYKEGIHYVYGQKPPKHFKKSYTEITSWGHTISFAWGTVVQFVSVDRPESSIGKSAAHVFADEMLRISETNFLERIMPTLRGDRQIHGKSPYFGGLSFASSTPNFENDHDWWLSYEQNVNKEILEEIMYVAYRVMVAKYDLKKAEQRGNEDSIRELSRFIDKWNGRLREKRKGETAYIKGSSFSNLAILGLDYMKNQLSSSVNNLDKFKLSILGIRPNKVKDMFFSAFGKHNLFNDSYRYGDLIVDITNTYKKTAKDLKYFDADKPILAGYDPGSFMSIVFAQEFERNGQLENRMLKNMYVINPKQQHELAQMIAEFFAASRRKTIYLYYDRAGNQRKYAGDSRGETDALIFQKEMRMLGWTVQLMSLNQRTIYYWEHFILFRRLMANKEKGLPRLLICENEGEELVSSINMSPLKRNTDGAIELDKTSEKKLDFKDQAFWSTQIGSAYMYLIWGRYNKYKPGKNEQRVDIQGL